MKKIIGAVAGFGLLATGLLGSAGAATAAPLHRDNSVKAIGYCQNRDDGLALKAETLKNKKIKLSLVLSVTNRQSVDKWAVQIVRANPYRPVFNDRVVTRNDFAWGTPRRAYYASTTVSDLRGTDHFVALAVDSRTRHACIVRLDVKEHR